MSYMSEATGHLLGATHFPAVNTHSKNPANIEVYIIFTTITEIQLVTVIPTRTFFTAFKIGGISSPGKVIVICG